MRELIFKGKRIRREKGRRESYLCPVLAVILQGGYFGHC